MIISNKAIFWSYLIFLIPSIILSLFVLYYLLWNRTLRHALNNHIIIVVLVLNLICEVTIYPWILYYRYHDGIWKRSLVFCEIWTFFDWGFYIAQTVLVAWATIERHVLIFHDRWVSTKNKRLFVHYLPIILLLLYCLIFYSIVFFFPPCANVFNPVGISCLSPCLTNSYVFSMWETISHQTLPIITILLFSIVLVLRVVWQKHRINQPVQWRKFRNMTIQLLSVSFLYLMFYLPFTLIQIIILCGFRNEIIIDASPYTVFFSYFTMLLFPFVCALSLPELRKKFFNLLPVQRRARRVGPEIRAMTVPINTTTRIQ